MSGRRVPIDEALAEALEGPAPFVVSDSGDSTNGGGVGDSTELLRAALRRSPLPSVLLSITAPEAALAAHQAGRGSEIQVSLGSGRSGEYNERVELNVRVERLSSGSLTYTHPVNAGYPGSAGATALVRHGSIAVVVHQHAVGVIDPAIYVAAGVDPSAFAVVQAKSHISYRTGFIEVTTRSLVADTSGPTTGELALLDYRKRPRPLFPFELD